MSEGPTKREVERVREALDRHDKDLREDEEPPAEEPEEAPADEDEEG
jgi:hypothetical protein